MGYASRQPLNTGRGLRKRSYKPLAVEVRTTLTSDVWSKRNGTVAEVTASHPNFQFQVLDLSRPEAEQAALTLIDACGKEVRIRLALHLLRQMEDRDFLHALAADLTTRLKSQYRYPIESVPEQ